MLNRFSFWFKTAILLQTLTGVFHSLSFFDNSKGKNSQEILLKDLMSNYKFDLGLGFFRSMDQILLAFSIGFALFLFFSAIINFILIRSKINHQVLKKIIILNVIVYFICFIAMLLLTFFPPIFCTGLILMFLTISLLSINRKHLSD